MLEILLKNISLSTNYRFNLTDKEGSADRKVPIQPLAFTNKEGVITRYNLRKVVDKYLVKITLVQQC